MKIPVERKGTEVTVAEEKKRRGNVEFDDEKKEDKVSEAVDRAEAVFKSEGPVHAVDSEDSNITKVTAGDTPYTSKNTFEELNLSSELVRALYSEMEFVKPYKIQALCLPIILTAPYQNLVAQAPIGYGKTTCFVLGMLSRVDPKITAPQALCVCPTREIAVQNQEVLLKMGKHTGITSVCAVEPTDAKNNVSPKSLGSVNDQVVIGTPRRMKNWINTKVLSTRDIKILVFDEADYMLAQDGFADDCQRIIQTIQKERAKIPQIIVFSATYNKNVNNFTTRVIPEAKKVFVEKELSLDVIKQYVVRCPHECAKVEVLKDKIFPLAEKLGQSIIFVRNRENASTLHSKLEAEGYKCTSIQGELKLQDRDRVIKEFRTGLTKILISTDVLRGFDQAQVTLVVNFDLPTKHSYPFDPDYDVYLHQIGRIGRFGRKGAAFNFICNKQDEETMRKIEKYFEQQVPKVPWDSEDDIEAVLKDAGLA